MNHLLDVLIGLEMLGPIGQVLDRFLVMLCLEVRWFGSVRDDPEELDTFSVFV